MTVDILGCVPRSNGNLREKNRAKQGPQSTGQGESNCGLRKGESSYTPDITRDIVRSDKIVLDTSGSKLLPSSSLGGCNSASADEDIEMTEAETILVDMMLTQNESRGIMHLEMGGRSYIWQPSLWTR